MAGESFAEAFLAGFDPQGYRALKQQQHSDLVNQLLQENLAERKREITNRDELAKRVQERKAAGDYEAKTSTELVPGEQAVKGLLYEGTFPTLAEKTTVTPAKSSPEQTAYDFYSEKGDVSKMLNLRKDMRAEVKDAADTLMGLFKSDPTGTVATAMLPKLKELYPNTIGRMGDLSKLNFDPRRQVIEGKTSDGTPYIIDAKGGVHTIQGKEPTEWGTRVRAGAGDKAAQAAVKQHEEEEIRLAEKKAKTDPMTTLLAREGAKVAAENRKRYDERRKGYEREVADLSKQWAKDTKEDPEQANILWNEAIKALHTKYGDLWDGTYSDVQAGGSQGGGAKQSFDLRIPADGIVDGGTWEQLQTMYKQVAGKAATKQGFTDFVKKAGVKGVRNVGTGTPGKGGAKVKPEAAAARADHAGGPAEDEYNYPAQSETLFGAKPGEVIRRALRPGPGGPTYKGRPIE